MNALTKQGTPRKRVGPNAPAAERIALHTERAANGCLIWTAAIDSTGYGRLTMGGKLLYAHRVSYADINGPIPDGMEIDHLCRVRACCEPTHLEAVPPTVNVRRGMSVGAIALRRNTCIHGHPYPEHAVQDVDGRRRCGTCRRVYLGLWHQLSREEVEARKAAGLPVVDLAAHYAALTTDELAS